MASAQVHFNILSEAPNNPHVPFSASSATLGSKTQLRSPRCQRITEQTKTRCTNLPVTLCSAREAPLALQKYYDRPRRLNSQFGSVAYS